MDFHSWNFVWALCFAVVAFLAAGGNVVTLMIFHKKQLRTRPHFLLISLAVADLLVGLLSIPLFIARSSLHNSSQVLKAVVQGADMFPGFASIFTLAVIALERMYAIGWPFRHRVLRTRVYVVAIAIPWIMAFVVTIIGNLVQFLFNKSVVALLATFLSVPVVVTCVAYFVLWKKGRSRRLRHQFQETKDLKLTKTVLLVTAAFLLSWLPFQVLILVLNLCISCQKISLVVVNVIKLLQFGNSVINIVIYPVRNKVYRKALFKMLSVFKCSCRDQQIRLSPANMGISVISVVSYSIDTQLSVDNFQENTRL
ncbi:histamine H2 receptor-like [Montipora capricornis]|uniref:histamine H2 receptor-like n=1 Tax=Montipora capricornis TaxID=246305 RepID=UPI0035F12C22